MDQTEINRILVESGGIAVDGEVNFLCPFVKEGECNDHPKGNMNGRFYIESEIELYRWHCFKCGKGGFINAKILSKLDVDRDRIPAIMTAITNLRQTVGYDFTYRSSDNHGVDKRIRIPKDGTKNNIQYFEERMGIKVNRQMIKAFSLILDLGAFAKLNKNILSDKSYDRIIKWRYYGIGFLSGDRSSIVLRDIRASTKGKYKYGGTKLSGHIKEPDKSYFIYHDSGLSRVLTIIMVEGQFDAIGIYIYIVNNKLTI